MVAPDDNLEHMHKYKYIYINTNMYTYKYIIRRALTATWFHQTTTKYNPVGNISFSLSTDISVLTPSPVETQV